MVSSKWVMGRGPGRRFCHTRGLYPYVKALFNA